MGGIGKTALAVKLARELVERANLESQSPFQFVTWRSLRNAPPLETLLTDLVSFLSDQKDTRPDLGRLVHWLRTHRCLVIVDNVETILQAGEQVGLYRPGYEGYGDLFRAMGETSHQSCVILTSREKPAELSALEGPDMLVRSLKLSGSPTVARPLIERIELSGTEAQKQKLCEHYSHNPLALKIVAAFIHDLFDGEIEQFLEQDTIIFNSIRRLLDQQFARLSLLEQMIMYWLAINREWTAISTSRNAEGTGGLADDLVPAVPRARLLEALEALSGRSLIEKATKPEKRTSSYTQQSVVMEYVTDRLVETIATELFTQKLSLLVSHALIKTTVKDYARESQIKLILEPIANKLRTDLGSPQALERQLQKILDLLHSEPVSRPTYGAGNLINFCCHLQLDLTGCDFSHLNVWQAYLQRVNLHRVNFAYADLSKSVFTQTLGSVLSVAFSPDGKLLGSGDGSGQVHLWQVADSKPLSISKEHTTWVRSVAFSPAGQLLASGSYDQTVKIWDVSTGRCLETLQGDAGWVTAVAFAPQHSGSLGEDVLAIGSVDQVVRLWQISRKGDEIVPRLLKTLKVKPFQEHGWIEAIAFSPNGQLLATSGSYAPIVRLWNLKTGECCQTLQGHQQGIKSVAFSPSGQWLASGSDDQTMRLWEIATGQCLHVLHGHLGPV